VSKRSPTNARYQKYQEPEGKTRKSAAAAKPARKAASTSASTSKSKSTATRSAGRVDPQTPEFKALRKRWWTLLLVGVVLVTASWGVRYLDVAGNPLHEGKFAAGSFAMTYAGLLSAITLGLAYACIFYALYLDFAKMRPMRMAASQGAKPASKPSKTADKPSNSDATDSDTD